MKEGIYVVKATGTVERPAGLELEVYAGKKKHIGKYAGNNSTMAFVDESQDVYVGIITPELIVALKERGYERASDMYVPHSNDGGTFLRETFPDAKRKDAPEKKWRDAWDMEPAEELGDVTDLL